MREICVVLTRRRTYLRRPFPMYVLLKVLQGKFRKVISIGME